MKKIQFFALILVHFFASAQTKQMNTGEILQNIKRLNVVGSALYIAAHPDDENTVFLSYLSKERMVRTAYLSMTRGDGGQNLIGPEQSELIGLIRTHELLEARKVDGPEQYFTRANDFGFSKTTEEALATWGKDDVLADVVWRIRKFQPDIIVARFPPDSRAGHGHHSASGLMAEEAFKAAADPNKFPEQLKFVQVWQAKRVVWNSFTPGFSNTEPKESDFIRVNIGDFNPLLGKSYTEIAAESRSMHKSQGFGSAKNRGKRSDFAVHKAGEKAVNDLFDGIDLSWGRVKGGTEITAMIVNIAKNFQAEKPSSSVPDLVKLYEAIERLESNIITETKKKEVAELILACSGLWFEANPAEFATSPNEKIKVNANIVKRSDANINFDKIVFLGVEKDSTVNNNLKNNEILNLSFNVQIPINQAITQPYWLNEKGKLGMYRVDDQQLRGLPMKNPDLQAAFHFTIENKAFVFNKPLIYKFVEPSDGEIYRPFEVRPEVTATIAEKVYAFADNNPKNIEITLKAGLTNVKGTLKLDLPKDWRSEPTSIDFELKDKHQEKQVFFKLFPSKNATEIVIKAIVETPNGKYNRGIKTIAYKHIPTITLFPEAEAKAIRLDLKKSGSKIGYIAGAGDDVPKALAQIGYSVSMLGEKELGENLETFDAIVVGVRAYNTEDYLKNYQQKLMDYVANGGTMVLQYQTNTFIGTLKLKDLGPYPFGISRDRVSEENAEVRFLQANHPLLNTPNKITNKDFEGWIQERGLYFADKWSDKYATILSMNDANETAKEGSLLYAQHGKGHYVFTGLSFFRELPAGVAGAYRLFANLVSVGK